MAALGALADDAMLDELVSPYEIGDRGIDEDAVALPGGGQASIDDLEAAGRMTSDLMRKARPDVTREAESPRSTAMDRTVAPESLPATGPAMDRYMAAARAPHDAPQEGLEQLYDLATREADEAGVDLPSQYRVSEPYPSYEIGDRGIDEDAVALPGGGQASIDDLETRGQMTPDLMRKARPDVVAAQRRMGR
jgi:hypothetical protein